MYYIVIELGVDQKYINREGGILKNKIKMLSKQCTLSADKNRHFFHFTRVYEGTGGFGSDWIWIPD